MTSDSPYVAVVDDEASVRTALGRLLRLADYHVAAFASGEAFLASASYRININDHIGGAADLGTALVRAPMSAQAHEQAGKILVAINAAIEARHHFETAIGLDPGRAQVISADLGRLDALEGNWAAADRRIICKSQDLTSGQFLTREDRR